MKPVVSMWPCFFYGSMFFIMLVVWVTPPFIVIGGDVSEVPRYVVADIPFAIGFVAFIVGGIYVLRSKASQRRTTRVARMTYVLTHGGVIFSGLLYFAIGTWNGSSEARQFYSAQSIGVFFVGWLLEWSKYRFFSKVVRSTPET